MILLWFGFLRVTPLAIDIKRVTTTAFTDLAENVIGSSRHPPLLCSTTCVVEFAAAKRCGHYKVATYFCSPT